MSKKMNEQHVDEMLQMGAEFFGAFNDPTEIKSTRENYEKIALLHPSTYKFKTSEDGKLIAWTVVIPTSKELANDFIERRITEVELLEETCKSDTYDALYLFAALTVPEYRKNGYVREMFREQIGEVSGGKPKETLLFAWTVTKEGEMVINALARELDVDIVRRKKEEKASTPTEGVISF